MKKEIQDMRKNGWFPILKTGTFKDSDGRDHTFTEDDLDIIADNYEPEDTEKFKEAPLTVGHPKNNSPAFGWVKGLQRVGKMLFMEPVDVVPEFAEAVKKKMYKYISVSIRPDKTLRHVGFLGGQPPAIPGLGPVSEVYSFSEDEEAIELSFDFAELESWKV
jgi:phage I-like protein